MSQDIKKNNFSRASLRPDRTARTVLLRMAADQDRAERIGQLKRERPDLTWRAIADRVDVSERAAIAWAQSGGIEYDNAKKLATVFDVDVDYIMRGRPEETPDPFATPDTELADRLDRIEQSIRDARTEREQAAEEIRRLLAQQTDLLATIRTLVERLGIPDGITLQDHVIETVRDAAARSQRPERRTRS